MSVRTLPNCFAVINHPTHLVNYLIPNSLPANHCLHGLMYTEIIETYRTRFSSEPYVH